MSNEIIAGVSFAGGVMLLIMYLMRRRNRKMKDFR